MDTISWSAIQSDWKERELPYWSEHIKKAGINTWEQFRNPMIYTLVLNKRVWEIVELKDPLIELPALHPNPLTRWVDFFGDKKFPQFYEIQGHPFLGNHTRIHEIADNFPPETSFIVLANGRKELAIDGHHRISAVDLMYRRKQELHSKVSVAKSEVSTAEWERITNRDPALLHELKMRKALSLIHAKFQRLLGKGPTSS